MMGLKTRMYAVDGQPAYPAVSVTTAGACCEAVKALEGRIMLATQAPMLPLRDCTDPDACHCRYRKYPDRRMGDEDRRFPYEAQRSTWFTGAERRGARGRREDDD